MVTKKELEEVLVQVNSILANYDKRLKALEEKPKRNVKKDLTNS